MDTSASAPGAAGRGSAAVIEPRPAVLVSSRMHRLPSQMLVAELFFDVPLDHGDPDGETIRLFARAATRYETPIVAAASDSSSGSSTTTTTTTGPAPVMSGAAALQELQAQFTKPWISFLEGGPGAGNRPPQEAPFARTLFQRGYQLLLLDYRGTGLSATISAATLARRGPPAAQAAYLRKFRADNIVRDLEAVRRCLTAGLPAERRAWSILGQSFGGFVSLTYLSFYPSGLREAFMTGGLAPVGAPPDAVYTATYRIVTERNAAYFAKFPEDAGALRAIAGFLDSQPGHSVPLPAGGVLTMHRVLALGYAFGFHGGLDLVHDLLLRLVTDIRHAGLLTRPTLAAVEQFVPFDAMPLYAVLHEALYCSGPGIASRWSAQRVGVGAYAPRFAWLDQAVVTIPDNDADAPFPYFFAGEMIYPFMFDTFPELAAIKEAAELVAAWDAWEPLYDEAQLAANRVPVYAASYVEDMYVDLGLARATAAKLGRIKVFETNVLYHNAIRARTEEVLTQLFRLRDDSID